jgi:hypothetical protein
MLRECERLPHQFMAICDVSAERKWKLNKMKIVRESLREFMSVTLEMKFNSQFRYFDS